VIPEYGDNTSVYAVLEQSFQQILQWQMQMEQLEQRMSDPAHTENKTAQHLSGRRLSTTHT